MAGEGQKERGGGERGVWEGGYHVALTRLTSPGMNQDAVAQAWVPRFVMSVARFEVETTGPADVVRVDLADVRGDIVRLQATRVHGKRDEPDMAGYLEAMFVTGTHVVVSRLPPSTKEKRAVEGFNVIGLFNISKEISCYVCRLQTHFRHSFV